MLKKYFTFLPFVLVFCIVSVSQAADWEQIKPEHSSCAVSDLNGKLDAGAGTIKNDDGREIRKYIAGSISIPVGCQFGLQIDGNYGRLAGVNSSGFAAHLFKRDPGSYLFGVYGSVNSVGNFNYQRLAFESELYFPRYTLTALLGKEYSDFTNDQFFGTARVSYYVTDNFQINLGAARFLNVSAAMAGLEWQIENSGFSLFADASIGDDDHRTIFAGVRYYFGDQKSLKRRHREDDPINWIELLKRVAMATEPKMVCVGGGAIWNPLTQNCEFLNSNVS